MRLRTYKDRVMYILEKSVDARNNDGVLMAHYIATFHSNLLVRDVIGDQAIPLKRLKDLPPIENLRRSRQIIQNDNNMYLPNDPKVRKARKIKEENWRQAEVREAKLL